MCREKNTAFESFLQASLFFITILQHSLSLYLSDSLGIYVYLSVSPAGRGWCNEDLRGRIPARRTHISLHLSVFIELGYILSLCVWVARLVVALACQAVLLCLVLAADTN